MHRLYITICIACFALVQVSVCWTMCVCHFDSLESYLTQRSAMVVLCHSGIKILEKNHLEYLIH